MNIYLNKKQAMKIILDHVEEELSTEELHNLLAELIKLYKKRDGALIEALRYRL